MAWHRHKAALRQMLLTIGLAALVQTSAQPVSAEIRVSGTADSVLVETREAPVDEVLAALGASFGLRYRATGALDRVVTGTYAGTLQRVVSRLLDGYDYAVQSSANGIGVVVFGLANAGKNPAATAGAPATGTAVLAPPKRRLDPEAPGEQNVFGADFARGGL
jgi:hypothetical protein